MISGPPHKSPLSRKNPPWGIPLTPSCFRYYFRSPSRVSLRPRTGERVLSISLKNVLRIFIVVPLPGERDLPSPVDERGVMV